MQWFNLMLILSISSLVLTVLVGYVSFPGILKFMIKEKVALKKSNQIYEVYLKIPVPLDFRVFFFNVSNPAEVQQGKAPVLKEVGPYCFDAWKQKIDVVENDTEDSLTYTPYETYFFNQERTGNLSPDDYVTILNPISVGMVTAVARDQPIFLSILNQALNSIFKKPQSMYITAKVKDILFDGIQLDCRVDDYPSKAVCGQIRLKAPGIIVLEEDLYLFSLLGSRNGTIPKRIKVARGINNASDLGRLLELDGKKEIDLWSTKECNTFKGTDGWIFPPFLTKEEGIWSFAYDVCRNIQAKYKEDTSFNGIPVRKYHATLGDMSSREEDKCYCPSPDTCLPKGIMDMHRCLGVPLYISLPHFLEADPALLEKVHGLSPKTESHMLQILFEPTLGVPVSGQQRLQFNLPVEPHQKIDFMKTVPEVIHPILWIEQGIEIKGPLFVPVSNFFLLMKITEALKIVSLLGSIAGCIVGGYYYHKSRKSADITPVHKGIKTDNVSMATAQNGRKKGYDNPAMAGHEFDKY